MVTDGDVKAVDAFDSLVGAEKGKRRQTHSQGNYGLNLRQNLDDDDVHGPDHRQVQDLEAFLEKVVFVENFGFV